MPLWQTLMYLHRAVQHSLQTGMDRINDFGSATLFFRADNFGLYFSPYDPHYRKLVIILIRASERERELHRMKQTKCEISSAVNKLNI